MKFRLELKKNQLKKALYNWKLLSRFARLYRKYVLVVVFHGLIAILLALLKANVVENLGVLAILLKSVKAPRKSRLLLEIHTQKLTEL